MNGNDDDIDAPASPPCAMHEVDARYMGLDIPAAASSHDAVMAWRKAERERLIAARLAIPVRQRAVHEQRMAAVLEEFLGEVRGLVVSAYWPFRGEPDLRPLLARIHARGGRAALPVVKARGEPLEFRAWTPAAPLERGVWNIPIPAADAEVLVPDVVIAPVVGYDDACFRLGYGGGFFDRTLAALPARPRFIGVGHAIAHLPSIFPQAFDIALDAVVTENGVTACRT
jgi:5-formyltetrahydrofolate cyclo-ligase